MFVTTLFIIAKTWMQPRGPSVGEWKTESGISIQWNTIQ